jgi:hypothetical protein
MNKLIVLSKIKEFFLLNKDLTAGELIYSIFRNGNANLGTCDVLFKIRDLDDNTIYTLVETAIEKEEK